MWNLKNDFKLLQRVCGDEIAKLKSRLDNQAIGEVYSNSNLKQTQVNANTWEWKITYNGDEGYWTKFSQKDIDDQVNGKIKIKNVWYSKEDVVFYNDISKKKKKVEKRQRGKK